MDNKHTIENNPLVSVIIPAYNRETLIGETLDSILTQTYPNWECIIVDDGSTDHTIDVIEKYTKKDNRFRLFKRNREPKGAPTCRNIGLDKAKGEYVIFLDSDDILFPHALKNRVNFLRQNPEIDFCISNGLRGKYPISQESEYKLISTYKSKDVLKEFFNITPPWVCLNPTYKRKSLFDNNIIWDEKIKGFQDIDFHTQTIVKQLQFEYINDAPDCLWTSHDNGNIGKTLSKNGIHFEQKLYILNKYKDLATHRKAIELLVLNILHLYYSVSIPEKAMAPPVKIIKSSCVSISGFALILLKLYRLSFKKKVPILPRIIRRIILLTGNKKLIEQRINTHFLKKEYTERIPNKVPL
ncbi:glycosyltransferase family 2 protein [Anaerophaga thermohalophila]|uniref:glycosyltransferase family 2 protein n=1 Tax=Anaerophaga thermohalophila TaxID=177400 RepID=UPI000237D3A1|nr:glycosyltransferase family 2 protein [Anaerophaga thermohalophila]